MYKEGTGNSLCIYIQYRTSMQILCEDSTTSIYAWLLWKIRFKHNVTHWSQTSHIHSYLKHRLNFKNERCVYIYIQYRTSMQIFRFNYIISIYAWLLKESRFQHNVIYLFQTSCIHSYLKHWLNLKNGKCIYCAKT
jgi:hypothetical protein